MFLYKKALEIRERKGVWYIIEYLPNTKTYYTRLVCDTEDEAKAAYYFINKLYE